MGRMPANIDAPVTCHNSRDTVASPNKPVPFGFGTCQDSLMDRMNGQNQTQYFQSNNYDSAANTNQNYQMSNLSPLRTVPRNTCGVRLRPVSDLRSSQFILLEMCAKESVADMYKGLFKFGVFNAVQSTCFDTASHFNVYATLSLTTILKDYKWKQEFGIFLPL